MEATPKDLITIYRATGYLLGYHTIVSFEAYEMLLNIKLDNLERRLNQQMEYLEANYKL